MKHKTLTVLLTLALALGLSCPVRADVPGERIDEWSARLSEDAQLSGAVFWTGSDYRTETCLTLAPGGAAAATVVCCEPLRSQERIREAAARLEARGLRVLGGTNGGYYTFATGLPVGIAVAGGVLLADDEGLQAVGFRADGSVVLGSPALRISLVGALGRRTVAGWNRPVAGGLSVYTPGSAGAVPAPAHSLCLLLRPEALPGLSGETETAVERVWESDGSAVAVPEGTLLLLIPPTDENTPAPLPEDFAAGAALTLELRCAAGWEDVDSAVGILYPLLEDGEVVPGLEKAAAPRTAVGLRADGTLLLYALDGRQNGYSVGGGLDLVARRLKELGCVAAGALDGGGSTQLAAALPGEEGLRLFSRPSEGTARRTANYILLAVPAAASGQAAQLSLEPLHINAVAGVRLPLTVRAADETGCPAPLPEGLRFTVSEGLGTVVDGVYHAAGTGSGTVTVSAPDGVSVSVPVRVTESPDELQLYGERYGKRTESLTLSPGYEVDLTVRAYANHILLSGDDRCYTWSLDPAAGTVDETGHLIPGEVTADGTLRVSAGACAVEIPIRIRTGVPFSDMPVSHPQFGAVRYVFENGIFKGTSETTFEPDTVMSRAMLVTVLWRMEGMPAPEAPASFADVVPGEWYADAVAWAAQRGIVKGYDETAFGPSDGLTREQVVTILHRWAGEPEAPADVAAVPADTDDWAGAALRWALDAGVLAADGAAAHGPMSRALVAEALMRYGRSVGAQ